MLLRESLGISADGSEKAFMAKDVEETMCTLQFATRVRGVELGAAKGEQTTRASSKKAAE